MIDRIQWLGHGSFLIQGPPIIYINPWRVARRAFFADVVLVGHDHYDHCSVADIEKVRGPDTRILGNDRVRRMVPDCEILRPWQSVNIDPAAIKAVPAYSPDHWQHPQSDGGLGFVLSLNLYDIYYAGDTKIIPEMRLVHPDIAILPIDNNGTLDVAEATELVRQLRPRWAIPCNWGNSTEGATRADAREFATAAGKYCEVIIPEETA